MAQLKSTTVSGSLRATDTIYTTTAQFQVVRAPTASGGTTYGPGTNGQVLKSNGTSIYWASDSNSDVNVTQAAAITTAGAYPIILANSTATTAVTGSVNKTSTLTYNPSTKALVTGGTINGYTLGAASAKGVTDNSSAAAVTSTDTNLITARTLYNAGYTKNTGTVTSVTLIAGDGISISDSSAITTSGTRTITNNGVRSITQGTTNGTIVVNEGGTISEVAIKGLDTAAYTASTAYATATQGTKADNAMPKSGGTFTGAITLSGNPTQNLQAATKQYVDNIVSVENTLGSGTEVGAITVNGVKTTFYAPSVTASSVAVTQSTNTPTLEFIVGTNTSQSNALTGVSTTTSIADGKVIIFYNQYAITGQATLNLTLASSGNTTSAIPIYVYGSTRSETHYPAGSMIPLIYYNSKFYIIQSGLGFVS